MKTAYYLAPAEHLNRFDGLFEEEEIIATTFDSAKIPSLTAIVLRDKAISQQNYFILDVDKADSWSISHILSAAQQLRRFSAARIIFLGEDCPAVTELFGILQTAHPENTLIKECAGVDTAEELRVYLSDRPRLADKMQLVHAMLAQQTVDAVKPLRIPDGLTIQAAVAGTMPRCGTTTQTFAVYHCLKSVGWKPAILDPSSSLLPLLTRYEEYEQPEEGVTRIHGVDFVSQELPHFNAFVTDCGVLTPEVAPRMVQADLSVLVGCTKPWELPAFAEAVKILFGCPVERRVTLASFSSPSELKKLSKYLGERTAAAPYHPDLWTPSTDKTCLNLLLPVLREICGMTAMEESER